MGIYETLRRRINGLGNANITNEFLDLETTNDHGLPYNDTPFTHRIINHYDITEDDMFDKLDPDGQSVPGPERKARVHLLQQEIRTDALELKRDTMKSFLANIVTFFTRIDM